MRINTQLRAISVGSIAVLIVLAPVLIWFFTEFSRAKAHDAVLVKINENFFERVASRDQYFLYRESRAATQWAGKKAEADHLLRQAQDQFKQEEQKQGLERLSKNVEDSAAIFQRILENTERLKTSVHNHQVYEELDKRLFNQLLVKSVAFRDDLAIFLIAAGQRVEQTYKYLILYILFLFVTLTTVTLLSSVHIGRLIRRRLAPLHGGAKLIADGDFGHQIDCDGADEFTDLTISINAMTNRLRCANHELETEIVERKVTENELLATTRNLQRAQQELINREQFSNAVFEFAPESLLLVDGSGAVVRANKAALSTFGYAPEKMLGLDVEALMPPRFRHGHVDLRTGLAVNTVYRAMGAGKDLFGLRADGSEFPAEIALSPLVFGVDQFVVVSLIDFSDRKAMDVALARYAAIVESTDDAIISKTIDGMVTSWNRGAEKMFGFQREEILGKSNTLLIPDQYQSEEEMILSRIRNGEWIKNYETVRQRKNGTSVDLSVTVSPLSDANGNIVGASQVARDISERKKIEETLQRSTLLLNSIVENIPAMVFVKRASDLRFETFNRAGELILGHSRNDVIGKNDYDFFPVEQAEFFTGEDRKVLAMLDGIDIPQEPITTASGEMRYLYTRKIAIRNTAGEATHLLGISLDITEQKLAEGSLKEVNKQLVLARDAAEAASEAKGQFVANMSHEIRSPMNAVLGMLQLLRQTRLDERQLDYASKAESAGRALLGILNDILDFSKVEAGKLELDPHPFSLAQLLRDLAVILSANVGAKNVEVLFKVDPGLPDSIVGDALRLQQILLNLAGNAIKFTEHGEVVLSVQLIEQTPSGLSLAFAIRDTGIGISPGQCRRIFEGFSQAEASTARRYGGSGLGLAISQRLVQMMGGTLGVDSQPGQGSTFRFVITCPRADVQAQAETTRSVLFQNLDCLVVDDNPTARLVLQEMAASFGWRTDVVESGMDALAAIVQRGEKHPYDVVFIDWRMPTLDGWETSRQIRQLLPAGKTPLIVMVTAHDRERLAQKQTQDASVLDAVLEKPVTASMLFDAVSDARLGGRQPAPVLGEAGISQRRLAGLRLLLVEDNPFNQQVACELLSHDGAVVDVADCGRAALDAVQRPGPPFDVILMDIQMPDMDGYATTRAIRALLGPHAPPIIAMTANVMASDREAALATGMVDHVGKPFDLAQLIAVILRHAQRGARPAIAAAAVTARLEPAGLAGWNSSAALARMGGNANAYHRCLRSFASDVGTLAKHLQAALAQQRYDDTARLLHTLKGLAGTVGADQLASVTAQAERILKAAAGQDMRAGDFGAVLAESQQAAHAAGQIAAQFDSTTAAASSANSAVDRTSLEAGMTQLSTLLATANMDAFPMFDQLQQRFRASMPAEFAVLQQAIEKMEFATAMRCCNEILQHSETSPS